MNIKQLEEILNIKIQNNTIIFAFPGIGIGKVYNELSGCTLETRNMEILARVSFYLTSEMTHIFLCTIVEYV